jgi:hypothetical protein
LRRAWATQHTCVAFPTPNRASYWASASACKYPWNPSKKAVGPAAEWSAVKSNTTYGKSASPTATHRCDAFVFVALGTRSLTGVSSAWTTRERSSRSVIN